MGALTEQFRWDQLRSDHGWAALQFQSVLRTTLHVPSVSGKSTTSLLIDLVQGTEFALVPRDDAPKSPVTWYPGDVYAYAETPHGSRDARGGVSNFARALSLEPGEYVLLVRAMYEIRMFGDPGLGKCPVVRMRVQAEVDQAEKVEIVRGTAIVPDVVDGWMMGEWMSVGIRVPAGEGEAVIVGAEADLGDGLRVELAATILIFGGQTRPVALRIHQKKPLRDLPKAINVIFKANISGQEGLYNWRSDLRHSALASAAPFKMTFASPSAPSQGWPASVSYAMVVPPHETLTSSEAHPPVILALHGAGVDAEVSFWTGAMPVRPGGWAVLPTGKSEWGEDWHGGSMADAWAAREALPMVTSRLGVQVSEDTLLCGHSNGGQGAWHLAARYPERIVGGESDFRLCAAEASHRGVRVAEDPGLRAILGDVSGLTWSMLTAGHRITTLILL